MKIHFECRYCGKKWTEQVYREPEGTRCGVCHDRNLKLTKPEDSKVDYYIGCPSFPKNDDKYNKSIYYDMTGYD